MNIPEKKQMNPIQLILDESTIEVTEDIAIVDNTVVVLTEEVKTLVNKTRSNIRHETLEEATDESKVEHSGDPHEYILGKHIKDWDGKGIAIINGEVIELTEEEMKTIRNKSVSNSTGNIV